MPSDLHRLAQYAEITDVVGQKQDELGIDQGALVIRQIPVGLDQCLVKIVTRREGVKIARSGLEQVGLQFQWQGCRLIANCRLRGPGQT